MYLAYSEAKVAHKSRYYGVKRELRLNDVTGICISYHTYPNIYLTLSKLYTRNSLIYRSTEMYNNNFSKINLFKTTLSTI